MSETQQSTPRQHTPTVPHTVVPDNYKWVALFISTLGMLMATIYGSITPISLPDIFGGIHIDPLQPDNSFYLLWMILGFLVVTNVLVTTLGRMGDIFGLSASLPHGLYAALDFAIVTSLLAAVASWTRGAPVAGTPAPARTTCDAAPVARLIHQGVHAR